MVHRVKVTDHSSIQAWITCIAPIILTRFADATDLDDIYLTGDFRQLGCTSRFQIHMKEDDKVYDKIVLQQRGVRRTQGSRQLLSRDFKHWSEVRENTIIDKTAFES